MPKHSLQDLLTLMQHLRDPEHGCPWDKKQSFETIVPHTLEEAYEVADAIERNDLEDLKQELGDLLFQVVFYSQLGREEGVFEFDDIIDAITEKLLRRHPHVFPDATLASAGQAAQIEEQQIHQNWEAIKQQERNEKTRHSLVDDIPHALPALSRARKLQKRVARVGFDWPEFEPVLDKLQEEIEELKQAREQADQAAIEEEMGDLLFTCVNMARHLGVDAEAALRGANRKFERRFKQVESMAEEQGDSLEDMSIDDLERLWGKAKQEA